MMDFAISETKKELAHKIRQNRRAIKDWYAQHAQANPPAFYSSIDLRDSGHKIVPVDSNLYPAGFNNICPDDLRTAPSIFKNQITAMCEARGVPLARRILVLPESHTSNTYYIENLHYLTQMLREGGFEVILGWLSLDQPESQDVVSLVSASGKELRAHPISVKNGMLQAGGVTPDLVILNNDFSSGYPKILDGVSQLIVPHHRLGWHTRKKGEHFRHYNHLVKEFTELCGIDPWTLQIDTEEVGPVNFNEDQGIEQVAQAVERVEARMKAAYAKHEIAQKPFIFVKNNSGTYGMGIMVVHSAEELRQMNRRAKNKMSVGKNRIPIESVVVQEGVPTATLIDRLAAEPVIYLAGCQLIGGFLRTNPERTTEDNLNSQGMVFRKLCMSDLREIEEGDEEGEEPVLELVYGTVARISALATGLELAEHGVEPLKLNIC